MPVETEYDQRSVPKIQLWAAYNHMPGGQIVVIHFEDTVRMKKVGDSQQNLLFTAKEQLEAFEKGEQVCINVGGQITKNRVLTYVGGDLRYNKKAADVVIAWAKEKGLRPVESKNDKEPKGYERDKRLDAVEGDVKDLKDSVASIAESMKKLADAINSKK